MALPEVVWRKTAEEIVAKVRRGRVVLASAKNATDHQQMRAEGCWL